MVLFKLILLSLTSTKKSQPVQANIPPNSSPPTMNPFSYLLPLSLLFFSSPLSCMLNCSFPLLSVSYLLSTNASSLVPPLMLTSSFCRRLAHPLSANKPPFLLRVSNSLPSGYFLRILLPLPSIIHCLVSGGDSFSGQ